jgi:YD repeat-containing protein
LLEKDGLAYTYNATTGPAHAPSQVGDFDFDYDEAGNRTWLTNADHHQINYRYDHLHRLAYVLSDTVNLSGTVTLSATQMVYDGDGQRIKRITEEGTTVTIGQHYEVFYPAPPNQTLEEDSGSFPKPHLAADSEGGRHLLYGVQYTHLYPTGEISSAINLSIGYSFDLTVKDAATAYALWQGPVLGQQYLRVTAIVSNTWLTTTVVSSGSVEQTAGSLAFFPDPVLSDTLPVVWVTDDDSLHYALVITETVTHTQVLTNYWAYAPRVAVDPSGLVHIIWRHNEYWPHQAAIYYTTISRTTGLSSTFELVSTGNCPVGLETEPALAVDAGGAV